MDNKSLQISSLSYETTKVEKNIFENIVFKNNAMHDLYIIDFNNACSSQTKVNNNQPISQRVKTSIISYIANQPADSLLWDGIFYSIFLFSLNKYLKEDAKNITCSLLRMVVFTKQHKLEDKTEDDISQISKFGFAA